MDLEQLRKKIIGAPLATKEYGEQQLDKIRALAALSPDALSSIAYANQEIFLGLVVAGSMGLSMTIVLGLAITAILAMLTLSYFQTIHAYPSGGGSWIVARENLGTHMGLIAAAALLIDYLLVAAVSLTAGVEAIASAFPVLYPHKIIISLLILLVIVILNLRGTREAGTAMSIPVYLFLLSYIPMLAFGAVRAILEGPGNLTIVAPVAIEPLTTVLLLHAFSSGCTALTGVEAISNAVPAFKKPKSENAGKTLIVMSVLLGVLFLGSLGLTQYFAVIPGQDETILSALARRILGDGPLYVLVQVSTLLILAVAANTAFTDFPRVTALLAKDSYIARQLSNLGDRLVFQNGMLLLSGAAAILIIAFSGSSHALVPLFAMGAFLAFTLSQAGMVIHWRRKKGRRWQTKSIINGLGALTTFTALVIIADNKFLEGAWITFILMAALVYAFLRIHKYYSVFDKQMTPSSILHRHELGRSLERAAIPVEHINQGTVDAVALASRVAKNVMGVHVEFTEGSSRELAEEWKQLWPKIPLHIVTTEYRSVSEPLVEFLEKSDQDNKFEPTSVVISTFVTSKWWQAALHNQTTIWIKQAIIKASRARGVERTIIEVPYLLKEKVVAEDISEHHIY